MSLIKEAMNGPSAPEQTPATEEPAQRTMSLFTELGAGVPEQFDAHMKSAGLDLDPTEEPVEKTAGYFEDATAAFKEQATAAVMAEAAANLYKDPFLARMMESGMHAKAASLAAGRYAQAEVMDKIASMPIEEVYELATTGLQQATHAKEASLRGEDPRASVLLSRLNR